ncbi:MAG: glycoside hydrolase family 3 C-terminal domain-containing protein [Promethearchaeota archaeon]
MAFDWNDFEGLPREEVERVVGEVVSQMTLDEKLEQMCGDYSLVRGLKLLRYCNPPIPAGTNKRLGIPPILFTDGPRGVVTGKATCFPVAIGRGASWNPGLERRVGEAIGVEARALGANYFGGVCINLLRHPAWGRAQETYGEDPYHLGVMGAALVRGVQEHGVMACAKHFACNSIENARFKVDVKVDERTLREVYLPHFKACVDAGVASVMGAYNRVNGEWCCHNSHLIRDILKRDWGFRGFVISDFIFGVRDGPAAVRGGLDVEMPMKMKMKPRKLRKALERGEIGIEMVDEAVTRVIRQKVRFARPPDPATYPRERVACEEHVALALEAALESLVLLKNEGDVLPLDRDRVKRVLVLGKLARVANIGDHGSSRVHPPHVVTPLRGIRGVAGPGVEVQFYSGKNPRKAGELANTVDAVVVVAGYTHKDEGEYLMYSGGDRASLRLKSRDEELVKAAAAANPNCVVVMIGGSAIVTEEWRDRVPAILMAWYPGMEGGTAIGKVLFGDFNPCGKLPCTFPKSADQLPFFDRKAREITYGYFHGYRLFEKEGLEAAFPFGHGLSYTSFSHSGLRLECERVGVDGILRADVVVRNTGGRPGTEVVQLYISRADSAAGGPVKELKAFARVRLDPGQETTLSIFASVGDFARYDASKGSWVVEPGEYSALVGPSSRVGDLLEARFQVV